MSKNKLFSLFIILIVAVGVLAYFVWIMFFNKGTVVVSGVPPFNVSVGKVSMACLESTCKIEMPVGDYSYDISKDNYYSKSGLLIVTRGDEVQIEATLQFIPNVLEGATYQTFTLPVGYSKFTEKLDDISLFSMAQGAPTLKKLPKKIDNIVFNKAGNMALVFEAGTVSLYNTSDSLSVEFEPLASATSGVFDGHDAAVYTLLYDDESGKTALTEYSLEVRPIPAKLIYFLREIEEYSLDIALDKTHIALIDNTFTPGTLYMVDLVNASRKNIFEGYHINAGIFSDDGLHFIFSGTQSDETVESVWHYKNENQSLQKLTFINNVDLIDFKDNQTAYFVSDQNYDISGRNWPYSVMFNEQEAETSDTPSAIDIDTLLDFGNESYVEETDSSKPQNLFRWDLPTGQFYLIKNLSEIMSVNTDRMEVGKDGVTIRLLAGELFYDIKLDVN